MTTSKANDPVTEYAKSVLSGDTKACETIKRCCKRHVADLQSGKFVWNLKAANHAIQFFSFLRLFKGEWAGQTFALQPFQQFVVGSIFGWYRPDGTRRFTTAMIFLPKKNAKSPLASGIGLYCFIADREPGAEVYAVASTKDQAEIVYKAAVSMVQSSPQLSQIIKIRNSPMMMLAGNSVFRPLASNSNNLDGLQPNCVIMDEIHQWGGKAGELYDIFRRATCSRRNPLILMISTAGLDQATLCKTKFDYGLGILSGSIDDDSCFVFISQADEGDPWDDPETWRKCNPMFGISVKERSLQEEAQQARNNPAEINSFKIKHLNLWTSSISTWIPLEVWDQTADITPPDQLRGRKCYGALDLSKVSDLTSWCLVFPRPEDPQHLDVIWRYWIPAAQLTNPLNKHRDQYRAWADQGYLTVIPGRTIDYQVVRQQILQDMQQYQIVSANIDRLFQGQEIGDRLEKDGLSIVSIGMGFLSLAAPSAEFERRVLAGQIHHGGNPVSRWMLAGTMAQMDPIGNKKPTKANREAKIDGIMTLVMALDRVIRHDKDAPKVITGCPII